MTQRLSDRSQLVGIITQLQCTAIKYIFMEVMTEISGLTISMSSILHPWCGPNPKFQDRYLTLLLKIDNIETFGKSLSYNVSSWKEALHVWRLRRRQVLQRHRYPRLGHYDLDKTAGLRNATHGKECAYNDSFGFKALFIWRSLWKQAPQGSACV